ncbi:hypothetical protein [Pseudaestuariivita sp.]|uniref:hypothetical protein n=1 Tax=Pseudaestuariivita sp. TaxID=2211669 RepID=UPI00405A17E4
MRPTQYIAETDDKNHLVAVWIQSREHHAPRVFDSVTDRFDATEPAEFSGASERDITAWLLERAGILQDTSKG